MSEVIGRKRVSVDWPFENQQRALKDLVHVVSTECGVSVRNKFFLVEDE